MTDSPIDSSYLKKPTVKAFIFALVVSVMPFTSTYEGTVYKAYKDPVGFVTICQGHRVGVHMGDIASKALCEKYYQEDMTFAVTEVLKLNPSIIQNQNAIRASGDFTLNAGIGSWKGSPMRTYFGEGEWTKGCNAFSGYFVGGTYTRAQKGMTCHPHPSKPGKWLCDLPGLVKRREAEKDLCLNGKPIDIPPPDELTQLPS